MNSCPVTRNRKSVVLGAIGLALAGMGPAYAADAVPLQAALQAPEALTLSGSFRIRHESLSGQARAGLDPSTDLVSLRSSLFAEYRLGSLKLGAELFDSRAYPKRSGSGVSTAEVNAFEPVQAYVLVDFSEHAGARTSSSLQIGRFSMNLGSRRVVAADDYRNTSTGFSGARFDFKSAAAGSLTLLYTQPQVRLPDDLAGILDNGIELDRESDDLVLWGGIATLARLLPNANVEVYHFGLDERDRRDLPTRNRNLGTSGLRIVREPSPGRAGFEIEGIHQTGTIRASTAVLAPELQVSAYFYHVEAGYQWATDSSPRLSLEYDYASGDDADSSYGRFDLLYGMRRGDFAPSGIYATTGRTNVASPAIRFEATPSPRYDLMVTARAFSLASATDSFATTGVVDATGRSGDFAGHQLDVRMRYWIVPRWLRFEVDAVVLAKGRFLEAAPNAPRTGDTRYLSLNVTSTF